ncbi:MAG: hypothetical protein HYT87_19710 [Nitrospirae bacterium]|nr:hypothetical protein [Nitrospirota bacterium]
MERNMFKRVRGLGIAVTLTLFATSCQKSSTGTGAATTTVPEDGIPMTVAIPLTPEQATALTGISEMSRIDELSRTDEMSRVDELSRVDEGIRGVALDIEVDGQAIGQGIRGSLKSGVRGGIRGVEQSGVRGAEAGGIRGSPRRQADEPLFVFEATFSFPIHLARDGDQSVRTKMRSTENPNVEFLTVTTQVEVKPTSDGGVATQVAVSDNAINLSQVDLKDSGDGVSVLTKVLVAGVDAALDPSTKVDEASVKAVYEQYAQKLEQTMLAQGYSVTVDVSHVDLTPPDTFVSREPSAVNSVVFKFTCNETYCTYRCSLEGSTFAPCLSPFTPAPAPGERTLRVAASDKLGNTDQTPASVTFYSDTTPPEAISITIENGAEFINRTLVNAAVKATDDNPMEMLLAQDTGLFEVKTVIWVPYAEQTKFSMPTGDGKKTVYVQFRDKAGNRSKIISDDIILDTKPPDTTVTCPPSLTNANTASIAFACTNNSPSPLAGEGGGEGCSFLCQLDTGTAAPCTNPVAAANLAEGAHAFEVKARDKAGNIDTTSATCSWVVDTTPPDTAISTAPASATNSTSASFSFTSPDTGAAFECELDTAGFAACVTPKAYTGLAAGSHTFKVRARDAAGNVDATPATHTWTIDLTPPTVAISSQPSAVSNATSATFTFTCNESSCTFTCSLNAAAHAACTSPKSYIGLADGSHTFELKATDAVGNTSSAVSYTWTIDATAPSAPVAGNITVTQNAPGTADTIQGPAGSVEGSAIVKVWADALLTSLLGQGTASASGIFGAISIGDNTSATVYITATDAAGNQSSSTSKTNDITPPVLSLTNVEGDGTSPYVDTANDANTDIAISAGEATSCKWDTTDIAYGSMANTCTSTSLCTVTGATTDGTSYTRYISCVDAAGNFNSATNNLDVSWTNDWSPPAISITNIEGDAAATYYDAVNDTNTDIAISPSDSSTVTTCKWDTTDVAYGSMANTCTSTSLCTITGAATDGTAYTRYVACIDSLGNANDATNNLAVTWTNDWSVPSISITNVEGDTAATYYDIVNDTDTDVAISITDASGTTACKWDTTDIAYGSMANACASTTACKITGAATEGIPYSRYISCVDAAGNANTAVNNLDVTWTNDWTVPSISIVNVEGDTAVAYYDTVNDSDTDVSISVTDTSGTAACKWDTTDIAYGSMANSCASSTTCTFTGAAVEGSAYTRYVACIDGGGNANDGTNNLAVAWTNDWTAPTVTLSSVEGDTAATYYDTVNDSNTDVAISASDAVSGVSTCKWDTADNAAGSMFNTCASTSLCTITGAATDGTTYTRYIGCVDAAGNGNTTANNLDVTWTNDWTAPTSTISTPTNNAKLAALTSITGTGSDTTSGLNKVEITISDGLNYWNGTTFGAPITWLLAAGTTSWSYSTVPSWASGTSYTVQSKATDNTSNAETPGAGNSFTFDSTAPTFGGAVKAEAGGLPITISWSAGSDTVTTAPNLVYKICQTTTAGGCSAFATTYTTSAGATSYATAPLTKNTTYYFVVRAQDEAGNTESNTVEKADVAGGNVWVSKTAMTTARYDLAAVAVNGKIYAIGGCIACTPVATNEEYDPVANTWATKTAMTTARSAIAAAAVNGKIYAIGGCNNAPCSPVVATNEEYDPVANTWATKTAMTTARQASAAAAVNGRIYVIGGYNAGSLATNEEYDPVANTWATKTAMTTARRTHKAVAVNGRIYVIGGAVGPLATNEEYDPVANTWAAKTAMTTARQELSAAAVNGRIYVIGGSNGTTYVATNEEYDPVANTWAAKTAMTTARRMPAAATVNGRIYVIGGGNGGGNLATNEEYDPVANTWATKTAMTTARESPAAAAVCGRICVLGGFNGSYLATNEEYDPVANTWATKTAMTVARYYHAAAVVNGRIYVVGGGNPGALATNEVYAPPIP